MKLSNAEKLAVLVTASCRSDLMNYFIDVKKVAMWVSHGNEWAIAWEYDWFESEAHPKDQIVSETKNILEMFQHIHRSAPAEVTSAGLSARDIVFEGFDGNNDEHYHIAGVMVDDLGRYSDVKGARNNSHSIGTLPRYLRTLTKYAAVVDRRPDSTRYDELSSAELKEIFSK